MTNKILMTVAEAAEFASVTTTSIFYHIHRSEKLYPIFDGGRHTKVLVREVEELYPASESGKKQHSRSVKKNRELTIRQITDMITENAIKGDFTAVENLSETLKLI